MKKVLILFASMCIAIQLSYISVNASSSMDFEVSQFIQEYSLVEPTWVGAQVHSSERLYNIDDELIGFIFRVFQKNTQQGYVIYLFDSGIIEAKFTGIDRAHEIKGKVYYITPSGFFSKKQVDEYYDILISNAQVDTNLTTSGTGREILQVYYDANNLPHSYTYDTITFTINTSHVPNLASNVDSYYMSTVSKVWIEDVPSYLNGLSGIWGSCAPTAGAMLVAYYDNELWNNLSTLEGIWWWQFFPIVHEDDEDLVNELILQLAGYFRTCIDMDGDLSDPGNCVGSTAEEIAYGLTEYLGDHNHSSYISLRAEMNVDYNDYSALILLGNPAIVNLSSASTYGSHSVLGMGFYSAYMSPSGIVIYDDWDHGEVWINLSVVTYYEFIYDE